MKTRFLIILAIIVAGFTSTVFADESPDLTVFDFVVEPMHVDETRWILHEPLDWSSDGKYILFRVWVGLDSEQQDTSLVLISPEGMIQKELLLFGSPITGVDHAQIAPTNDMVHILDNGNLYRYVLATDEIVQLNTEDYNALFFDYYVYSEDEYANYSIVYSVENRDFYPEDLSTKFTLLIMSEEIDIDPKSTPSEFFSNIENPKFQFSPDGKKILFLKIPNAENGEANRIPAYIKAQDFGPHNIPNVYLNCGDNLKWSPNSEIIVYLDKSCGRGERSGMMGLASLDGFNEKLIPTLDSSGNPYPRSFVLSPDGSNIVYVTNEELTGDTTDFYKLILAKPIPEFSTTVMLILLLSALPVLLLKKQFMIK